ncbi:MAG: glucokinase [Xanthobacteraceae bacterium]|nr:glucokinase [Xanthobacteraceae bacterium]
MAEPSTRDDVADVILADVGGTNARFAVLTARGLGPVTTLAVHDYPSFADAVAALAKRHPECRAIRRAFLALAGVIDGDHCALTNSAWIVERSELCSRFGWTDVRMINDFEAVAWSLPHLSRDHLHQIGGHEPATGAPMVALGPGTGLGVAGCVPDETGDFVLRSEGGHVTVPSGSVREDAVIALLRQRLGHVSAERVVSGQGLEHLYRAIRTIDAQPAPDRTAPEITRAAVSGECTTSRAALDLFCALLGEMAGNFALSFDARGGIFIAGGIARHIVDHLSRSDFRSRFDAKGRMSRYVAPIPVYLILHDNPAFVGMQALAERQVRRASERT